MASEPMTDERLAELEREWLQQCGHCDGGLPMTCTCATGDPRVVVSQLVAEVRRLREDRDMIENLACDQADDKRELARDRNEARARVAELEAELAQLRQDSSELGRSGA